MKETAILTIYLTAGSSVILYFIWWMIYSCFQKEIKEKGEELRTSFKSFNRKNSRASESHGNLPKWI
ncbi:Oidioi.mRNA.OKI2018_I69.PAR.g9861.t1.cds [Oikopleura dioica]|uniref:Oidioi.mRNA.OKI2018_I69.PAR.g9861.t1.cds n=1 Tax=Oikopleura dioica TaxID=34765 RepID=A0ABN7RT16_OIKDI|nr:Oidioi.mRNA.OKI2018_I69.PAR.g9861.t1.cds [Oikopleura dioica]